jgi:RNA polymerase sigma-70 factor (ECF subfamily)
MEHKDDFEELVTLHALGALKGKELKKVEEHLKNGCKACMDILEETELVLSLLPYSLSDSPFSENLLGKILRRIDSTGMAKEKPYTLDFEEIFDRYGNKVYGLALTLLEDRPAAEEVVEKVFARIRDRVRRFEDETKLLQEIYRLSVDAAISKLRRQDKKKKRTNLKHLLPRFKKDGHHHKAIVDWSQEADEIRLKGELSSAFNHLPIIDHIVLVLSDVEGMSNRVVGDMLKLSPKEVRRKLHRGRLLLRGNLAISLGY